jgi:uncharacterized protein (TIGR03437 family)
MTNSWFLMGALLTLGGIAHAQVNVLTANYDNSRTNANPQETILNPSSVNALTFGKLFTIPVDGVVYAQPLYISSLAISAQGTHNILMVATMHNSIYAFDADTPGPSYWQTNFGPSVPSADYTFTDILPEVGILSTPVIDPASGTIYAIGNVKQNGAYSYQLHALDLATGMDTPGSPVQIQTATVAAVPFDPFQHLQRPGLLLSNGVLYIAFGSHADQIPFHGWLFAYDASTLVNKAVFNTTATGLGSGIWQAGRGVVAAGDGSVMVITGNGDYDGVTNWGESVLRLSAADLTLQDSFTRNNWFDLNGGDMDFGSAGLMLVPGSNSLVTGGKEGKLYTIDRTNMGRIEGSGPAVIQSLQAVIFGIFNLALFQSSQGDLVYLRGFNDALKAFPVDSTGSASNLASSVAGTTHNLPYDGLAVSSNGTDAATGIVWETTTENFYQPSPGLLYAYAAADVSRELWSSTLEPLRDGPGVFTKFANPTVANGKVYVPTSSGRVSVYGLTDQSGMKITRVVHGGTGLDGPIAPGELIAIFGTNLASSNARSTAPNGFLPVLLHGVRVLINGIPAPLVSIAPGEIDAIVPNDIAGFSTATVLVESPNGSTPAVSLPVSGAVPGLFTLDDSGSGPGAILNADITINGEHNRAQAGSMVVLYATGEGLPANPFAAAGAIVSSPSQPLLSVTVTIGGEPARVLFAGTAPGLAGILQVNVLVPPDIAADGAVPVVLSVGEASSPFGVTLAVR